MDMDINTSRKRSTFSNTDSSRVSSVYLKASSIPYHKRMKIQSNNLLWSKQIEIHKRESFSLLYTTPKVGDSILANKAIDNSPKYGIQHANKETPVLNDMSISQDKYEANNNTKICPS